MKSERKEAINGLIAELDAVICGLEIQTRAEREDVEHERRHMGPLLAALVNDDALTAMIDATDRLERAREFMEAATF